MASYQQLHEQYNSLLAKSREGDKAAFKAKAEVMNEIRNVERESARAGKVISYAHDPKTGKGAVIEKRTTSKRSLQEEYIRKFDDKKVVKIDGKETTLQDWHRSRLIK
jgi:hypothetical protein